MKTCIVTGGAGFIGSWLCSSLLEKGHRVICVDNLITGREENIKDLEGEFTFLKQDMTNGLEIEGDVDCIFHLASPASPIDYQKIPIKTMMANSVGTLNALKLAKKKEARILLASTSEVYGEPEMHPQEEGYWGNVNPVGPRSCYDESKRFAEALAMAFIREYKMDIRIARLFNTYGPRMRLDDGRVVPNFMTQAAKGEPVTVYGDGKQTRSFCYVEDMVEALEKFMFTDGLSGEILNLGNPGEFSVIELAEKVRKLLGSESEIVYSDLPEDDPTRRKPDISRARKLLGWEPTTKLDEGLKKSVEWFQ
jgi:dTDP-glucose 4,6-dehydratase